MVSNRFSSESKRPSRALNPALNSIIKASGQEEPPSGLVASVSLSAISVAGLVGATLGAENCSTLYLGSFCPMTPPVAMACGVPPVEEVAHSAFSIV